MENSQSLIFIIIAAFMVVFPLLWIGIVSLISVIGGWRDLARTFPDRTQKQRPLQRFDMVSMEVSGLGNYRNTTTIELFREGVRFSQMFLFKAGHPPFFISKDQISVMEMRKRFFRDCLFLQMANRKLRIYGGAGKAIYDNFQRA